MRHASNRRRSLHLIAVAAAFFLSASVNACIDSPASQPKAPSELLRDAAAMQMRGDDSWGKFLRREAAGWSKAGSPENALWVLEGLRNEAPSLFDAASAHRMRGQYLTALGRYGEAIAEFESQLRMIEQEPELHGYSMSYVSGVVQVSSLLASQGDLERAVAWNERLVNPGVIPVSRDRQPGALLQRINWLERLGRSQEAISCIDRLLTEFAPECRALHATVDLRLRSFRLEDSTGMSDEYLLTLWSEWGHASIGDDPESAKIGVALAQCLVERGEHDDMVEHCAAVLDWADRVRSQLDVNHVDFARHDRLLRGAEIDVLSRLQSADKFGRPDLAIRALRRLEELATDARSRQNLADQRRKIEESLR